MDFDEDFWWRWDIKRFTVEKHGGVVRMRWVRLYGGVESDERVAEGRNPHECLLQAMQWEEAEDRKFQGKDE